MVTIQPIYNENEAQQIINQQWVIEKLSEVGDSMLKEEYKKNWAPSNPTYGYCYLISELLYHYVYPKSKSYSINMNQFGEYTHWFLKDRDTIIDYTGIQFADIQTYNPEVHGKFFDFKNVDLTFKIPYPKARRTVFFDGKYKTKRGTISERSVYLGEKVGLLKLN